MTKLRGEDMIPSRVSFYVNEAFRDIANRIPAVEYEKLALSSTSSGEDKMFLPADCERVLSLSVTTGLAGAVGGMGLRQTNPWEVDAQSFGTHSGMPEMFASYATWLQFYPSPNSAYSLQMRYVGRYAEMVSYTATPSVDTRYHLAGLFRAVELLSLRNGNDVNANVFHQRYEKELANQPSPLEQRQQDRVGFAARLIMDEQ